MDDSTRHTHVFYEAQTNKRKKPGGDPHVSLLKNEKFLLIEKESITPIIAMANIIKKFILSILAHHL